MKNLKYLSIILLFLFPVSPDASAQKTKLLKPKNADARIYVVIGGKNRIYYPVAFKEPAILTVKGPGKIKVLTRTRFRPGQSKQLDYNIFYKVDGSDLVNKKFSDVRVSTEAKYKDGLLGMPGESKIFEINLDIGEHTIELWRGTESPDIDARYIFRSVKPKKQKWIALSPLPPVMPVDLVTNEDITHYYRFSKSKPLKIKVIGPTLIQVLSRIENHYDMKGRINYRLQVKEDGMVKNTYLLCSLRSDVTSYKNDKTKVPGKAKEIILKVPKGVHYYEITPLDKDKNSVLGRILIPKKDVKLEE